MIVICGGGTGGHLAIAKTLNEEIASRDIKTIFIGSTNGQDRQWFENDQNFSSKFFLPSQGVVNKKGFNKLISLFNIVKLAFKCRQIFKDNKVKAVISVGGYSAAPAAFAAIISNIPLFIHEQNSIVGNLNKILKPFAKEFFSSYDEPKFDYPVADKFFDTSRERKELRTIIFLGGSQGASAINSLALNLAMILKEKNIKIIHQCGKNSLDNLREEYKKLGFTDKTLELFDFSKEIELKMKEADLAISRAGAGTLWELCANNLPAIFIPYPYAANNHQMYNAKFLVDQNLAKFCFQKDNKIDKNEILQLIESINLREVSLNLKHQIYKNSAKKIIDEILFKITSLR
ncbi:undecaprenyldiphospho-muramoylpentapeptide beta-N-acetylglucosaminyltransferase [Campylobacter sp. RM16190]|uniref:undecaprenyldiphospho-muramoylpentapeptide beta-N-acetylglucosaminyltransferase n=1 Tax=Campylobacter sp. RM16190 TaxID=1705727 RepID=UPI001476123A|nr:undecaprenyldiphospho-muramoylpentapeptide beta-N-acetylglucosaminyltransferase [Campylobacter sp. RM16190]